MAKQLIPGEQCVRCLQGLIEATVTGCGLEGEARVSLAAEMAAYSEQCLAQGKAPALIASGFFALARERTGVGDPFTRKKAADFAAAREAVQGLGPLPDSFAARSRAAIMGNAIDHFFLADTGRLWSEGSGLELARDDLASAEGCLRPGGEVVLLADNCGEQSFDRMLVEHLLARGCQVSYVVKAGTAQNDLTLADLRAQGEEHGLGRVLDWSPGAVGLDPEGVPPRLAELLARADLVIAKGMGHYETLALGGGMLARGRAPWPLLLLFLAKCSVIAASLDIPQGQGVALYLPPAC